MFGTFMTTYSYGNSYGYRRSYSSCFSPRSYFRPMYSRPIFGYYNTECCYSPVTYNPFNPFAPVVTPYPIRSFRHTAASIATAIYTSIGTGLSYLNPFRYYNTCSLPYFPHPTNSIYYGQNNPNTATENTGENDEDVTTNTNEEIVANPPISAPRTEREVTETDSNHAGLHIDDIRSDLADTAAKYIGYGERDGSFRKFSNHPEWCSEFIAAIVRETYQEKGLTYPTGFGFHRVENMKQWGIANNKYLQIAGQYNRAQIIAANVKKGDILILRENGASHTGFVTKVYADGSFDTIEGNVRVNGDDKVVRQHYNANDSEISGFVQLA